MDILQEMLKQVAGSAATDTMSKTLKADKKQIESAASMLIPSLVEGLNNNAQNEKGVKSLMNALDDHGSQNLSDINGFLNGVDLSDGQKILGHIFGNKTETVQKSVAKQSGLSQANTMKLMMTLAPFVMAYLGNQKKQAQSSGGFDMGSLVGMLAKGSAGSILANVLGSAITAPKATTKKATTTKKVTTAKTKSNDDLVENVGKVLGSLLGGNKK